MFNIYLSRKYLPLLLLSMLLSFCDSAGPARSNAAEPDTNPFVGAWLLDHVTQKDSTDADQEVEVFDQGLIMYSADGYMSAILTYTDNYGETPGLDVGYCGRYEYDEEDTSVSHLRDVIAINADTEHEIFVRDYKFSKDNQFLTLSPREDTWRGTSLTWKRVE